MNVPFLKEQSYERKLCGYTFLHLGGQEYLSLVKKK